MEVTVGSVALVVYRISLPGVVADRVTVTEMANVPPLGEIDGVTTVLGGDHAQAAMLF